MSKNERKYVEKVLKEYDEKKVTKLDELRALDKKVRKVPTIFAYIFGSLSSLVLGFGMCVAMKIIFADYNLMWLGIIIGLVGIVLVSVNYFIYKKILECRKVKYSNTIKSLSEELLYENN